MCNDCAEFEKTFQSLRDRVQQIQLSFALVVDENLALRFEVQNLKDKLANSVPVVIEGKNWHE
jgi:regulator of replication initiation timing